MIPPPSRPSVAHPREQFQQVTAIRQRPAEDSETPARQVIGEPGYQPPVRRKAATANDTIEHSEAPAGEGPQEDTSYYRGFASLHDQVRRADTRPGHNITPRQPGNGQRWPQNDLETAVPGGLRPSGA